MEVKCANKNKLGKIIKNGVALVVLAGGLTIINPVKSNGGYDIVNAAVDLSETKEDAINELKTVYKKYLKKYYTSKSYTKLTKYYKNGVELINNDGENEVNRSIVDSEIKQVVNNRVSYNFIDNTVKASNDEEDDDVDNKLVFEDVE